MKRHSSKKMDLHSLLRNRNVLYVVLFFSVMNLFSYLMMKQLDAVAFFIIIGFLTTYFSKNMIIIMLTAVISTFFLVQINLLGRVQEGMGTMRDTVDASGNKVAETETAAASETATSTASDTSNTVINSPGMTANGPSTGVSTTTTIPTSKERSTITAITQGMESTTKKPTEKFTQKLSPARYNASDDDDDPSPRHKPKIDYAATLESAYDNLDKLLSSDAIKNMSEDTGRLADKQKQLMDNIGKLTPIMDKASSVLSNLDMGGISGLMGGIQDRLKGFGKDAVIPGDK